MRNRIDATHKGTKFEDTTEMLETLGLNYTVQKKELFLQGQKLVDDIPVIGHRATNLFTVCGDDGIPLGSAEGHTAPSVTEAYQCIQNSEAFGIIDGLMEQGAKYNRHGILDGGKRCFIELDFGSVDIAGFGKDEPGADIKRDFGFGDHTNSKGQRTGDIVKRIITVYVSHDGTSSISASMSSFRLICSNGMVAAGEMRHVKIRHSKSYKAHLEEAKRILGIADTYYKWFEARSRELYAQPLSHDVARKLLKRLVPDNDKAKRNTRTENIRNDMFSRFVSGRGNNGKTYWDLYNGITENLDHAETTRDEVAVYKSNALGSGSRLKEDAFELLVASRELAWTS